MAPLVAGADSKAGVRLAVTPARVNVTDETEAAGEYEILMLNA